MITRYSTPEMMKVWCEENRWQRILDTWIFATEAMEELGTVPPGTAAHVRAKVPRVTTGMLQMAATYEKTLHHDVVAFQQVVNELAGEPGRHLHKGMTSSDVLDTGTGKQIAEAGELIMEMLDTVIETVRRRALEHKDDICIGRTHGIHAEPTTFGLKLLGWYDELVRCKFRLEMAIHDAAVGAISGAVGTYSTVDPMVEIHVCNRLGIGVASVTTQVISRDRHAAFITALALLGSCLERYAVEIRHLQRTEVSEAMEPFGKGQKGSSAMPHKKNPILTENVTGAARLLRSYSIAAMENIALWHERDISHSSVERVILPDACNLLHFTLRRFNSLMDRLVVRPNRMLENLHSSNDLWASQRIMLALIESGLSREEAYAAVQPAALAVWDNPTLNFRGELFKDDRVLALPEDLVEEIFNPETYVTHRDEIFERVLGDYSLSQTD
ncbi:MAG: adenylosuccinate lyase [Candidatus Kerfeldbacteria bacterium]